MAFSPESGGPTTQAGIYFQNCVATLRLAHMLSQEIVERPHLGKIVSVRIEAPEEVDDTVVTYETGRKEYIQSKISVSINSDTWRTLWRYFYTQYTSDSFNQNKDGDLITLAVRRSSYLDNMQRILLLAETSSSQAELISRLTQGPRSLLEAIQTDLGSKGEDIFRFLSHISLWQLSFESDPMGTDSFEKEVRRILYKTVAPLDSVFSVLIDLTGKTGRTRGTFNYPDLKAHLEQRGIRVLRDMVQRGPINRAEDTRLLAEIDEREAVIKDLTERIKRIRGQWAIETDEDRKYTCEKKIDRLSAERATLTQEIDSFVEKLGDQSHGP
jgi:hypothetical protein